MSRVHLGINACFAVKRWPEPDDWMRLISRDLHLAVAQVSTDLLPISWSNGAADDYVDEVRSSAHSEGVEIHSFFTGLGAYSSNVLLAESRRDREAAYSWYRNVIELAARSGARGAGGHVGAFSVRTYGDDVARQGLQAAQIELMKDLATFAAGVGLDHLQFENLAVRRETGHSVKEASWLEEQLSDGAVPWVLCLDLGHPVALARVETPEVLDEWLTHEWRNTPVVQVQQTSFGSDQHGPFTPGMNQKGAVDRDRVLNLLKSWDAEDIYLFLEVIPSHEADDQSVVDGLIASVDYWREGLAQHEFVTP